MELLVGGLTVDEVEPEFDVPDLEAEAAAAVSGVARFDRGEELRSSFWIPWAGIPGMKLGVGVPSKTSNDSSFRSRSITLRAHFVNFFW